MYIKLLLVSVVSIFLTYLTIIFIFFNSNSISIGEKINFQTRNGAFKFTAMPSKGRDHLMLERKFKAYLSNNGKVLTDTTLYRTTSKNYLKISKWCQYRMLPEWHYPLLR